MAAHPEFEALTFSTDVVRQKSRRQYILLLKLLLLPFLMLMGFASGGLLAGARVPGGLAAAASFLLGFGLPWTALRALNRRLRFWYRLRPDGLETGPGKFSWHVPYDEVSLIRETHVDDSNEPALEVVAGKKTADVLMDRDAARACAGRLAALCPCAVWVDDQGVEHPPFSVLFDGDPGMRAKAVRNLEALRDRYLRSARVIAGLALAGLCFLAYGLAARAGLITADEDVKDGLTYGPLCWCVVAGLFALLQYRAMRRWDKYCRAQNDPPTFPQ